LKSDKQRVSDVVRPVAYRKTVSLELREPPTVETELLSEEDQQAIERAKKVPQWALDKCGFVKELWEQLDVPFDTANGAAQPKPIGMIDIGSHLRHPGWTVRTTNTPAFRLKNVSSGPNPG